MMNGRKLPRDWLPHPRKHRGEQAKRAALFTCSVSIRPFCWSYKSCVQGGNWQRAPFFRPVELTSAAWIIPSNLRCLRKTRRSTRRCPSIPRRYPARILAGALRRSKGAAPNSPAKSTRCCAPELRRRTPVGAGVVAFPLAQFFSGELERPGQGVPVGTPRTSRDCGRPDRGLVVPALLVIDQDAPVQGTVDLWVPRRLFHRHADLRHF